MPFEDVTLVTADSVRLAVRHPPPLQPFLQCIIRPPTGLDDQATIRTQRSDPGLLPCKRWQYVIRCAEACKTLFRLGRLLTDMGFRLPSIDQMYHRLSCNVFIISYRGYGDSEGTPSEQGLMLDAEAVLEVPARLTIVGAL